MSDLGALLRKAREQRGYTLDDIQDYTKIRKRYLEAIETGDYKVLPGSFYVRAFVKTYAETVGLDAEEVLRLYHKELPLPTTDSVMVDSHIKTSSRSVQHNDRFGKVAVSLLMWAFPILIVVVIYIYLSQNKTPGTKELGTNPPISTETHSETPTPSVTVTPSPSVTVTPPPSVPATTLTFKENRNSINYYEVSGGASNTLKLDISDKCWIEVRANSRTGKKLYYETVTQAQTLTFPMTTPIYVNVGRTDFVTFYVDDATFDDGNRPGSTKYMFTPLQVGAPNVAP
jgi:cytoskeletal protein RodZ